MFLSDFRYALRGLWVSKGFAATAILCLAFGIGLNTTIFSVVDGVLLKPFPYHEPDRLAILSMKNEPRDIWRDNLSYDDFKDWRDANSTFEQVAAFTGRSMTISDGGEEPARYTGGLVTWNLFPLLGISPVKGQHFTPRQDSPGGGGVALISHAAWTNRYHQDPNIIGRKVLINAEPVVIVGVMPERFEFPNNQKVWMPLAPEVYRDGRGPHRLFTFGRMKPGVSWAQAGADLDGLSRRIAQQYPDTNKDWTAQMRTLSDAFIPANVSQVLWLMMAGVTLVLFIACSNVANLQLARASARRREISVRAALGAERRRIVTQLLTESVALSLVSLPLGLILAQGGSRLLFNAMPVDQVPYYITWTMDWRSFAFSIAIAVGTAILFGFFPALQASRGNLHGDLKEGTRGNSVRSSPLRSGLVVAQVALAVVALIGALLFVRTFSNLDTYNVGFDTKPLMTMRFQMPGQVYEPAEARAQRTEDIVRRVEGQAGVESAYSSTMIPVSGNGGEWRPVVVDGTPTEAGKEPLVSFVGVSPHFFKTLGVSPVMGRDLTESEGWSRTPVAVVNQTMAKRMWPAGNAVGGRFRLAGQGAPPDWFDVIGVVRDIKHDNIDPGDEPYEAVYVPLRYQPSVNMGLVVRTSGSPAAITSAVRQQIREADANLPVFNVRTMDEVRSLGYWQYGIFGWVFGTIGVVGLLLAAIGVYGVLAYSVSQRTQEIGVRIALGARPPSVVGLIVKHGMILTGIGVLVGLGLAGASMANARQLLFEISPYDPLVYAGVALFILTVALIASGLPALRATRVDPLVALRGE